jgi:hypothetical protein
LIQILGFSNTAPLPWLRVLFDNVILPTISAAATANLYDVVLGLEYSAYNNYTKAKDEAEHFRTTVNKWIPDLRKSGKSLAAKLPPLTANGNTGSPPRVAFYLQNSEILGHTEALVSFLRGLTKVKPTPLEALLYIAGPANPDLDALLTNCPVEIVYVDTLVAENPTMSQVLMALRADCAKNGVVAFVYVSLVLTMAFGFAMGLAPVQIWWSMKYHSLEFSEIDGYLALGSFDPYREIDGRRWRAVHRAMGPLVDPGLAKNAVRIRRKLLGRRGTVLLGCIGREEKMICEPYIAALTGILASVPEAVYFWTGKTEHPGVIGLLRKYGIEEKCRYVGWIDTRLYAQVVDVFVDSFPFASGLTAFEAMAAGRPVVSMLTRESLGTGMPAHVWPAYAGQSGTPELQREVQRIFSDTDGSSLLPFAETVESYRRIAVKLCRDSILRANVGNACRLFVERYMSNDERMAETGSRHILEIIDAKLDHRRRVG